VDSHPEVATEIMKRAIKRASEAAAPLKTVTMRLPVPDLKIAQDLAQDRGFRIRPISRCSCTRPSRERGSRDAGSACLHLVRASPYRSGVVGGNFHRHHLDTRTHGALRPRLFRGR